MTHIMLHMHFVVTSFSMWSVKYFTIFDKDPVACGSLIWDMFLSTKEERERERERGVKDTMQGILKLEYQSQMETGFILGFRSTF